MYNEIEDLIKNLVNYYPIYGSSGIELAQNLIYQYMLQNKWDKIFLDRFYATDIKNHHLYIDVKSFDHIYSNYENIEKVNVIGILEGTKPGPTVILNGHVDVDIVDSYFKPFSQDHITVTDELINGRGTTDMISGLATMLVVASKLSCCKEEWGGRIIFCSVCDEEIGGNGTLRSLLFLNKLGYLDTFSEISCIIAEPTCNIPCLESLGFLNINYLFKTDPLHMGIAKRDNNSLYAAINLINNFEKILSTSLHENNFSYHHSMFPYNFGVISGGTDPAIPINRLELKSTIFFPSLITADKLYEFIDNFVIRQEMAKSTSMGISIEGVKHETCGLYKIFNKGSLVKQVFPSPCDARLYKYFNIPAIIYGPGSLEQAHSLKEFIYKDSIRDFIQGFSSGLRDYLYANRS